MENFDPEKAARVWQRVQSRESLEPMREDPADLSRSVQELAALYQALARVLPGKNGERVRQLLREVQGSAACLRGLCALAGRAAQKSEAVRTQKEPPRRLLEKCYHRERKLLEGYTKRISDPEWGQIYSVLASGAGGRCVAVLEILGGLAR